MGSEHEYLDWAVEAMKLPIWYIISDERLSESWTESKAV
jgi:hypothetical protein